MQNTILMFIHLMAAAIGVGSIVYGILLLLPAIRKLKGEDRAAENSFELKIMDILAPTVFTCLLTLILTGVYYLLVNYTEQVNLKPGYYNVFGMKMICVVAVFGLSVYQTFGLRSRISDLDLRPENKKRVPQTLDQMTTISQFSLWAIVLAIFFGVWMARF